MPSFATRRRFPGITRLFVGSTLASVLIEKRCDVIARAEVLFGEVQARAPMLTPTSKVRSEREHPRKEHRDADMTRLVDGTLEDSFPASDPPSWTASIVRPAPAGKILVRE
jgi:hypothetical protein